MKKSKILIVDDDCDVRWAIRNVLADAGFDVEESDGGGTALIQAANDPPRLCCWICTCLASAAMSYCGV